jgi:hypothetical protein
MASRDVVLFGTFIVFALGLGLLIIHYMTSSIVDHMTTIPAINASAGEALSSVTDKVLPRFDYVVFGFFIGFVLAYLITSYFIGGHPIFMFVYFLITIVAVLASTILSNIWETATTTGGLETQIISFPITNHLMTYLPAYTTIVGFIGIVAMFAKPYFGKK